MELQRVLVVEDDLSFRETLVDVLRTSGFDVIATRNAREAMSAVEGDVPPAVIILDLMMSGINGQQLSKLFKENDRTRNVPILALSGAGPEAVLEAEVDWFLSKPVDVQTLLSTLKHLISAPYRAERAASRRPSV